MTYIGTINFAANIQDNIRTTIEQLLENTQGNIADTAQTVSNVVLFDGAFTVTQSDGDAFVLENVEATAAANTEADVDAVQDVEATAVDTTLLDALKAELAAKQAEMDENSAKIEALEAQIAKLQEEINKEIEDALAKVEDITEEQAKKSADIAEEWLAKFANQECSYQEMQDGLRSDITASDAQKGSEIAAALSHMFSASSKMGTLKNATSDMGRLIDANKQLETEIAALEPQIQAEEDKVATAMAAAAAAAALAASAAARVASSSEMCEPTGFIADNVRYDFFIDKDGDGLLSNEMEFVGAESGREGWRETVAVDGSIDGVKDNKVTTDELVAAGVKIVKTDMTTGEQTYIDADEVDDIVIDLGSYNTEKAGLDENDNEILGNFFMTFGGQEIEGYNTFDRLDWLKENYNFSKPETVGVTAPINNDVRPGEATPVEARYAEIQKMVAGLEEKMDLAWVTIFRDQVTGEKMSQATKAQAMLEASVENQKQIEEAEEAKAEAEAAEEAEKEKEKEEEELQEA